MVNGRMASPDGPIKTFPLRGIKDSPPYLHDGRLLTLEDTVEFFNLVLGLNLTEQEKKDLVAFMRALVRSSGSQENGVDRDRVPRSSPRGEINGTGILPVPSFFVMLSSESFSSHRAPGPP